MGDVIELFAAAMRGRNLIPPSDFIVDGKIHRCHVDARHGKGDGSYVLHLDGLPAGAYINWTDGIGWQKWHAETDRKLTAEEKAAYREKLERQKALLRAETATRQGETAVEAQALWNGAKEPDGHPYLARKGVGAHGTRRADDTLLIPMFIGGSLMNLQRIFPDGSKRFLRGGRTRGCQYMIGAPGEVICLAEGFITGASIHEATGYATVIAFGAGNLLEVAGYLRKRWPRAKIVVCADNDTRAAEKTGHNVGIEKATEAALSVDGLIAIPPEGGDFNDLAIAKGSEIVKMIIETANATKTIIGMTAEESDLGTAEKLIARHGDRIRYCPSIGWLVYDGKRWEADKLGKVSQLLMGVARVELANSVDEAKTAEIRRIDAKANGKENEEREQRERSANAAKKISWWKSRQTAKAVRSTLEIAQTMPGTAIHAESLDYEIMLLNVLNGTINLKTGNLRKHSATDMMTMIAPVNYDPNATAPTWTAFLDRIFSNDIELIKSVQRYLGYAITGSVDEEVLAIFYGSGANGKTTLLKAIAHILGDYYRQIDSDLLLASKSVNNSKVDGEKARLKGLRIAMCAELAEARTLSDGILKQVSSNDQIVGKYLYHDTIVFPPTHKLVLTTNHLPTVRSTDHGTWRRLMLIPFGVTIPESGRDPELANKLIAESSGILRWLVEGCLEWQRAGLVPCDAIMNATRAYRSDQDVLAQFIDDVCQIGPRYEVGAGDLYRLYVAWATSVGERPRSQTHFGRSLAERGFRRRKTTTSIVYEGIGSMEGMDSLHPFSRKSHRGLNSLSNKVMEKNLQPSIPSMDDAGELV